MGIIQFIILIFLTNILYDDEIYSKCKLYRITPKSKLEKEKKL